MALYRLPDNWILSFYSPLPSDDGGVVEPPVEVLPTDSVFEGLVETATLTFSVPSGLVTTDPDTGVEVDPQKPVTIQAFLQEELNDESDVGVLPGADNSSTYYEGYCVSPMILPEEIGAGMVADYSFTPEYGRTVTGKFVFARKAPTPFGVVQEVAGDEIQGWLVMSPGE